MKHVIDIDEDGFDIEYYEASNGICIPVNRNQSPDTLIDYSSKALLLYGLNSICGSGVNCSSIECGACILKKTKTNHHNNYKRLQALQEYYEAGGQYES